MNNTIFVHDGAIPGAINFDGKLIAIGKGFKTTTPDEVSAIVRQSGGHIGNADKPCDMFIVSDKALEDEKNGKLPIYLNTARNTGNRIVSETEFWDMTGIDNGEGGANRWVLVDPRFDPANDNVLISELRSSLKDQLCRWDDSDFNEIKDSISRIHPSYSSLDEIISSICKSAGNHANRAAENENNPSWDNNVTNVSIAPYRLYIQRWTTKSVGKGAWSIIACGTLDNNGYPLLKPTTCFHNEGESTLTSQPVGGEYSMGSTPWYPWRRNIGRVVVSDKWSPLSCAHLFDGLERCPDFDIGLLDTSQATSMESMFSGCSSVENLIDIDRFDTSQVTSCAHMFATCLSLRVVSMDGWDVSRLSNVDGMFSSSSNTYVIATKKFSEILSDGKAVFDSGTRTGMWIESLS